MRFADNFNPEWGYLAPAPVFMRTLRLVVVAAVIGASAGGAVVFSLIERPGAEETSVAARTLAQPANSAAAVSAPQPALIQAAAHEERPLPPAPQVRATGHTAGVAAAESTSNAATAPKPASAAALVETPAAATSAPAQAANEIAPAPTNAALAQKKAVKKPTVAWHNAPREPAYGMREPAYGPREQAYGMREPAYGAREQAYGGQAYGGQAFGGYGNREPLALLPGGSYPPRGDY